MTTHIQITLISTVRVIVGCLKKANQEESSLEYKPLQNAQPIDTALANAQKTSSGAQGGV